MKINEIDEPVDTANDTFDAAVQKYLKGKGLARGSLTYAILPDVLKVNNYAKPEQWLKNAGISGKNPGTVVSKADLENLAAYLKQNAGAMGTEAPQAQQTQINIADYAAKLKADPQLAAQVKAYLQQGNTR